MVIFDGTIDGTYVGIFVNDIYVGTIDGIFDGDIHVGLFDIYVGINIDGILCWY